MIAASTHEEANVALGNWLSQRARWLKGFMQTWLVHMRDPPARPRARAAELSRVPGDDHRSGRLGPASSAVSRLSRGRDGGRDLSSRPARIPPRLHGRHRTRRSPARLWCRRGRSQRHRDPRSWRVALVAPVHAALLVADLGRSLARFVAVPARPSPLEQDPPRPFESWR